MVAARDDGNDAETRQRRRSKPATVEWILGLASGLLVVALMAFLLVEAVDDSSALPALVVATGHATQAGGSWLVPIELANEGDSAAADVIVETRLVRAGREVERVTSRFDYVAPRSLRRGGVVFTRDPAGHEVSVGVTSFAEP